MPNPQNVLAHRWKPGCPSPNPQGRRSDKSLVDHVLQETRDGAELGDILLSLARHAKRDTDRIEACDVLLERLYGKVSAADRHALFGALNGATEVQFSAVFGPRRAPGDGSQDDAVEVEASRVDTEGTAESDAADDAETPEASADSPEIVE